MGVSIHNFWFITVFNSFLFRYSIRYLDNVLFVYSRFPLSFIIIYWGFKPKSIKPMVYITLIMKKTLQLKKFQKSSVFVERVTLSQFYEQIKSVIVCWVTLCIAVVVSLQFQITLLIYISVLSKYMYQLLFFVDYPSQFLYIYIFYSILLSTISHFYVHNCDLFLRPNNSFFWIENIELLKCSKVL